MEEDTLTLYDETDWNHDFTEDASATNQYREPGQVGDAIHYDQSADRHYRVNTPAFDALSNVSIVAWYSRTGTAGASWGRIFTNTNGAGSDAYSLTHRVTLDQIASRFTNTTLTAYTVSGAAADSLSLNTYHHVAMTWTPDILRVYYDGVESNNLATTVAMFDAVVADSLGIGSHPRSTGRI